MEEGSLSSFMVLAAAIRDQAGQLQPLEDKGHGVGTYILIIFIFILINGFFSASEMALVTINQAKVKKLAEDGGKNAQRMLKYINDQSRFIAMVQVGVTLAGYLSSAFAADRFVSDLYEILDPRGAHPWLQLVATVIVTLIVSYFSLIFGELVPKRIGINYAEKFALFFAPVYDFFDKIFSPLTHSLNVLTLGISKLLGIRPDLGQEDVTEEQIQLLVDSGSTTGAISASEAEIITNIFQLDDTEVASVMTPRTSMVCLQADTPLQEVWDLASQERYSRLPVYEEDIDNIIGILHIKDLLRMTEEEKKHFSLRKTMRKVYLISETKNLTFAFKFMRERRASLAVVIDEYGGTEGIISIEDILEEVVGDIQDEYDDKVSVPFRKLSDNTFEVDGMMDVEDLGRHIPALEDLFEKDEDKDDYDTIAGFVLARMEKFPEPGDSIRIPDLGFIFQVQAMDEQRISQIKIILTPHAKAAAPEEPSQEVTSAPKTHGFFGFF